MQHELNIDGYRNREYRPYILGEDTTFNTVMYDPNRNYISSLYKSDTPTLQPYKENVQQFFNMPRQNEVFKTYRGDVNDRQPIPFNGYATTKRGTQGQYALLYTT